MHACMKKVWHGMLDAAACPPARPPACLQVTALRDIHPDLLMSSAPTATARRVRLRARAVERAGAAWHARPDNTRARALAWRSDTARQALR